MVRVRGKQDPAEMITCHKKVEISLLPKRGEVVPDEVYFEILSWLPVKCVLRFKCVCKSWKIITQETSFIQKHMSRSKCQSVYEETSDLNGNQETFKHIIYINGLVLEKSEKTGMYRIRNPSTKQVLQVLDDPEEQGRWLGMSMGFDSLTNNYKLICLHLKKGKTDILGTKVLTVGTDLAWRTLDISLLYDNNMGRIIYGICSKNIKYIISLCKAEVEKTEIVGIKLKDESFMKIKIPRGFQTSGDQLHQYQQFVWDAKLSIGFIIEEELHVWVLENFDKQIWSEKKIIPLHFIKSYSIMNKNLVVHGASKSRLRFSMNNIRLDYDIDSKQQYLAELPPGKKVSYNMVPCLISLQGMHLEHINPSLLSLQGEMHLEVAIKPNMLARCLKKIRGLRISSRNSFLSCKTVKRL